MVPMLQILRGWAFNDDHDVHHFATPHRVVHRMHVRAQPHRYFIAAPPHRDIGHRQQGPVRQMARHPRTAVVAQHNGAQLAPHTIGQHQGIPLHHFIGCGANRGHALCAQQLRHFLPGIDIDVCALLRGTVQHRVQICAMDRDIGRTITFHHGLSQRSTGQYLATQRTACHQLLRHCSNLLQRLLQPPSLQATHHIRPQLHTRTHLRKHSGPFKQACIPASVRCPQRCSHACNATTCDQYLFFHGANCGAETGGTNTSKAKER